VWAIILLWANDAAFPRRRILHRIIGLLLLIVLLALMPKSAMLALLLISLYILFERTNMKPIRKVSMLLSALLAVVFLYLLLPGFQSRLAELLHFLKGNSPNLIHNSVTIRHLIYSIDLALWKQHWLWGLGPMDLQEELNKHFEIAALIFHHPLGTFNTHNEYFNQWLSFGLGGMSLFLFSLITIIRKAWQKSSLLFGAFIALMLIAFLTENILSRQHGVLFYSFFISFFFFKTDKSEMDLD
jgi:hypothetical protein